jgi:hypothetical protein
MSYRKMVNSLNTMQVKSRFKFLRIKLLVYLFYSMSYFWSYSIILIVR